MDNQQVRLLNNDPELSWVAGIIEGEGHIGLAKKTKGDFQYMPRIMITNTDETLLDELGKILRDKNLAFYRRRQDIDDRMIRKIGNKVIKRNRKLSEVCICGVSRVRRLLEAIIPYIRGEKKARAIIVRDFCKNRMSQYKGKKPLPYTDLDHKLYKDFRSLVENPRDYTLNPIIRDDIVRTA
jgi:hypothetical protein